MFDTRPAAMPMSPVLPGECAATFDAIKQELHEEFHPRSAMETWLINGIATQLWRLMRTNAIEQRIIDAQARRIALERYQDANSANQEDTAGPLTAGAVLAELFIRDESEGLMRLACYQGQMQRLMLRMLTRLQALRKRPDEDLLSREEQMKAKYPGFSESYQRTGWPDIPDAKRPSPSAFPSAPDPVRSSEARHLHHPPSTGESNSLAHARDANQDERSQSNPSVSDQNPLWRAANAVVLPDVKVKIERTKPTETATSEPSPKAARLDDS
jgi:hypothetical protein